MLLKEFTSVPSAKSRDQLLVEVVRFAGCLGFETVNAMIVVDHVRGGPEFICVDNTPAGYRKSFADLDRGRRDPVMQHCTRAGVPIIWNQDTYTAAGKGHISETQAPFGYHTGIAFALHLPGGRHFVIGVDRDRPLPAGRGSSRA